MLEMSMSADMEMRVTPALLNLAHMLSLPGLALHTLVQQELIDNPALDETDIGDENDSIEQRLADALRDELAGESYLPDDIPPPRSGDPVDPLVFVAAPRSLEESLLGDLRASLPECDYGIALLLVGNLDEHGFLTDEPTDIALTLGVEQARVDAVLQRLREIGPPGIATPNVCACLLAQIDALAAAGVCCPYVREIVRDHLDDLGARRFKQIARRLRMSVEAVEAARDFVRRYLWPYPMQAVSASATDLGRPRYNLPDVSISEQQGRFVVEVLHSPRRLLRLNPLYTDLARRMHTLPEEDREHVQKHIMRARTFLANLRQRETTLQQITEVVIQYQEAFLHYGVRALAPLTRAEVAAQTGLHESTVSRATSDKTVLLPDGTSMPFSNFFGASLGVQDVLRELINSETTPLSDAELSRLLNERGYNVARRTVTKYRERLNILPSTLR